MSSDNQLITDDDVLVQKLRAYSTEQTAAPLERTEWLQLGKTLETTDSNTRHTIITLLKDLTSAHSSKLTQPGPELLVAALFSSIYVSGQCQSDETDICNILAALTRSNPHVDYGNVFPKALSMVVQHICSVTTAVRSNLGYLDALLSYARDRMPEVSRVISELVCECSKSLNDPGTNFWRHLLALAHLLPSLKQSKNHVETELLNVVRIALGCLQTKHITHDLVRTYAIFEFLSALSDHHDKSIHFLADLSEEKNSQPGSNNHPFAIYMTSVLLESAFGLNCLRKQCKHRTDSNDFTEEMSSIFCDHTEAWTSLLDRSLTLLTLGIEQMYHEILLEDTELTVEPLACHLDDQATKAIWIQLSNLGETLSEVIRGQSDEFLKLLTLEHLDDHQHPTVRLVIRILPPYLSWLSLHYATHYLGLLEEKPDDYRGQLTKLEQRFLHDSLTPISSILWPSIAAMLHGDLPHHTTDHLYTCIISLAKLSCIFPTCVILPPTFSWNGASLCDLIVDWLSHCWCLDYRRISLRPIRLNLALLRLCSNHVSQCIEAKPTLTLVEKIAESPCCSLLPEESDLRSDCILRFLAESHLFALRVMNNTRPNEANRNRVERVKTNAAQFLSKFESRLSMDTTWSPAYLLHRELNEESSVLRE